MALTEPIPPLTLDAPTREALAELLLSLADDEFVIGFWDSEWTGIAPMLEEDVATSSIAQDEIGHARALYELLADVTHDDADRIAFGRAAGDYRHAALLNHARGDWAFTVARRFLYEHADAVRLEALAHSSYEPLAGLATKIRREESYHLMHWDLWLRRLADGSGEARPRLEVALARCLPEAGTIFTALAGEDRLLKAGILPEWLETLRGQWLDRVTPMLAELGLGAPNPDAPHPDGRARRTEDFTWLHSEFTMVARSEEGALW